MEDVNSNIRKIYPKTQGEHVLEAVRQKLYEDSREPKKKREEFQENRLSKYYSNDLSVMKEYNAFKKKVKEDLLAECMYKVLIPALRDIDGDRKYKISKGLVQDFIQEEGVENLLRNFQRGSLILYEMYDLTNNHYNYIMEKVDNKDRNTFMIDTEDKDNFFEDLDNSDLNSASVTLRERISSSIDDFVIDNIQTKAEVQEIIQNTQERIDANKNESVIEDLNRIANKRILELNERKTKTLLEGMVYNVTESAMKNDEMKALYCENNKVNMDKIVDDTTVIYGFLEMVNMCKMKKIDESYLSTVLKNLKK